MGNNRRNGNRAELKSLHFFSKIFGLEPGVHISTSRFSSKKLDNYNKVDLNIQSGTIADKFKIQVKETTVSADKSRKFDVSALERMIVNDDDIKILHTHVMLKVKKRRTRYGSFITLEEEDFIKLLRYARQFQSTSRVDKNT